MGDTVLAEVRLLTSRGPSGEVLAEVELHGNQLEGHIARLARPVRFGSAAGEDCLVIGARLTTDGKQTDTRLLSRRVPGGGSYLLDRAAWELPA